MKNKRNLWLLVAITVIIGFAAIACDNGDNLDNGTTAHTHTPGAAATCLTAQVCTDCDSVIQKAKGHDFGDDSDWVEDAEEATCIHPSQDTRNCKNSPCTEKDKRTGSHSALGHDVPGAKAATCMADGTTGTGHCKLCNGEFNDEIIKSNPDYHDFSGEPVITPATCTTEGKEVIDCGNGCSKKHNTTIDALKHNYPTVTPATCTTASSQLCGNIINGTACGHDNPETKVPALGHLIANWTTNLTSATVTHACDRACGTSLTLAQYITAQTKEPVALKINIALSTGTGTMTTASSGWIQLRDIIRDTGKKVDLDLSGSTLGNNKTFTTGNNSTASTAGNLGLTNIVSIKLPDSVTSIDSNAFRYCTNLTSVTIPNSVTTIDNYAFSSCTNLTSVTIPASVTTINTRAFDSCTNLTSVNIPASVTTIGDYAFQTCYNLTNITIDPANQNFSTNNGVLFSTTAILFVARNLKGSVTIPKGVTSIDDQAFYVCTNLTSITIPDSVTSIGSQVFYNCTSLTSVTIGNGVTSIGNFAFSSCTGLTNITIPASVTSIGSSAFSGCTGLTSITVDPANPNFSTNNGVLFSTTAIIFVPSAANLKGSVTIPNGVTSIGSDAFRDCTGLTSITIPASVTSISNYAFYGCTSLTSIAIPDSVTSIGQHAFRDCKSLASITIPDSVTSIGNQAFDGCTSLKSVIIPNKVTSISNMAFRNCTSLTSVTIPDSVTSISSYAFQSCSSLTSVTIPNSVTSIGDTAFQSCSSLTSVTIPDSVTSISSSAFRNCYSLTSITIPDNVTSIGNMAFQNCSGLSNITIPNSVTSIGTQAFSGCTALTSVTFERADTTIASDNSFISGADLRVKYPSQGAGTYILTGTVWAKRN